MLVSPNCKKYGHLLYYYTKYFKYFELESGKKLSGRLRSIEAPRKSEAEDKSQRTIILVVSEAHAEE